MSRLDDFDRGPLVGIERAQARFLWAKYLIGEAQTEAWKLWFRIGYSLIAVMGTLAGIWAFLIHGGK